MKREAYIPTLLMVVLCGCSSPKSVSTKLDIKQQTAVDRNRSTTETNYLTEAVQAAVEKVISEKLDLNIRETEYDTDKPVNPETGKPPVKRERDTAIKKNTDSRISKNNETQKETLSCKDTTNKSRETTETEVSDQVRTETGLKDWQRLLIVVGLLALSWLIFHLYSKLRP